MTASRASTASGGSTASGAGSPPRNSVVETHMSTLIFIGDRVLKLRRPVAYPFADLRLLSRRRADCEREVELNRRLAPDVYLGTVTASLDGEPLEYGVLMRRLPAARNLEHLIHEGQARRCLREIAAVLAEFHDRAPRSARIDAAATASAMWQRWQATGDAVGSFVGTYVDRDRYRSLTARAQRFITGRAPLFADRIEQGAICDGHGDLQAADIFCLDNGPQIIDCLEFDDEWRFGDVLADVVFLAADLERLGAPDLAAEFLEEYGRRSGRAQPAALVHFYVAARAHVRLLVACMRLDQGLGTDRRQPARLLRLAADHLQAAIPRMVLVGGPPGSGKTTLAAWIGEHLGAEVLATDRTRPPRRRGSTPPDAAARYSDAARAAVYDAMLARASSELCMGRSVVLDATWQTATMRDRAARTATEASADLIALACDAPEPVRTARIDARIARGGSDSEATAEVGRILAAAQDPWPDAARVDTSGSPEQSREAAGRILATARRR